MKINVSVKIKSKTEGVEPQDDGSYIVRVNVAPTDGKANNRVTELLADFFNTPKSNISLVGGMKNRKKVFEIRDHTDP